MIRSRITAKLFLLLTTACLGGCRSQPDADLALRSEQPATPTTESSDPLVAATPALPPAPSSSAFLEQRLFAADGAPFDHLGFSVAASHEVVVSGARFADLGSAVDAGAVYVYTRTPTGWREQAKLLASDPWEHDRFGHAVSLDRDTLVVGAHAHHELGRRRGSVYVFARQQGTFREQARLALPDSPRFGHAVAVSGDWIAVGAPGELVADQPAGAVHVFRRAGSSWQKAARLTAHDAAAHDLFGISVAIDGDLIVVGAAADDEAGSMTGAAYVFRWADSRWQQEAKLLANDAAALNEFGKAVAIAGATVVVGAEGAAADVGKFTGAAYVFARPGDTWQQEAKLLAKDRRAADRFGNAVAIDQETIVVGAHFADDAGLGSGAAVVFHRVAGAWQEEARLVPAESSAGEEFGNAVAVFGPTLVMGALRAGPQGTAAGSLSLFERTAPPPDHEPQSKP